MDLIELLKKEIFTFFSIDGVIELIRSSNYSSLNTWKGLTTVLSPLIPFIVMLEVGLAFMHSKFKLSEYKIPFLIYVFNRIVGRFISLGVVAFCIGVFEPIKLLDVPLTWYGFIFGYVVWEFSLHLSLPRAQSKIVLVSALHPSCA